ncbi:hypothetical protein GCM10012290_06600 [Halolactibacillus alkaliphilus]|uniref:Uncharacterized protein n=1 Tax=Halolactibacillus alkaliphilus TaxID=442899 RepID=A0A511WZR1_9BACI|nr:hypothetical protein [Halolactibacillus alkaliphilus]GEN56186.1 hypothetical protein HAL01_06500 [Halolactibacillus alkaliphilus]GGN66673.1 hypothetical protein GCM10012290_06600 [Halolactibacillus alkaliphilus]SFO68172.1 hypothetical protein SAMN05720591_104124 [Halolactibacillus alkaliphilus]
MRFNKDKVVMYMCIIGLIWMAIVSFFLLDGLRTVNRKMEMNIQSLTHQLSNIEYNIPFLLENTLLESDGNIHLIDFEYLSVNRNQQEVIVDVNVILKESLTDAIYYLKVSEEQPQEGESHVLTYVDDTTYNVTLSVNSKQNNNFTVIEEREDGSKRMMSETAYFLPIYDDLIHGRMEFLEYHYGLNNNELTVGFGLTVRDFQLDDLGLAEVSVQIWHNGVQVAEEVVTDQLSLERSSEIEEYYTGASVSDSYYYEEMADDQDKSDYYYDGHLKIDALRDISLDEVEVIIVAETHDGITEHYTFY